MQALAKGFRRGCANRHVRQSASFVQEGLMNAECLFIQLSAAAVPLFALNIAQAAIGRYVNVSRG